MTQRTERGDGTEHPTDEAERRRGRFGTLPERIRPQDMVESSPATPPDPDRTAYDPDEWLIRYCG